MKTCIADALRGGKRIAENMEKICLIYHLSTYTMPILFAELLKDLLMHLLLLFIAKNLRKPA
jgi:hypothetical protein